MFHTKDVSMPQIREEGNETKGISVLKDVARCVGHTRKPHRLYKAGAGGSALGVPKAAALGDDRNLPCAQH